MTRASSTIMAAVLLALIASAPSGAASIEIPVVTGAASQENPAAGSGGIAWTERSKDLGYQVMANSSGSAFRVNPAKTLAAMGGIDVYRLVYQEVGRSGSDIVGYDLFSKTRTGSVPHVNTRYWEWGPTVSGDWVLFSRNNINYGMNKEWEKVILANTSTGEKRTLASVPAAAYLKAGQVNGNWATWESFTHVGGWKVVRYDITTENKVIVDDVGRRSPYDSGVAPDGTLYYAVSGNGCGVNVSIMRRKPDGTVDELVDLPDGTDAWDFFEYTATPSQDVYYTRVECGARTWKGDIYFIAAADTKPGLGPVGGTATPEGREAPAEAGYRPPPALPLAERPAE